MKRYRVGKLVKWAETDYIGLIVKEEKDFYKVKWFNTKEKGFTYHPLSDDKISFLIDGEKNVK